MRSIVFVFLFYLYSAAASDSFDVPLPVYGPDFAGPVPVDRLRWPFLSGKITESLEQLKIEQGREFRLVSILSADHQYMNGSKYTIAALFAVPNVNKDVNCNVTIWEQEWMLFRHFEIKCGDDNVSKVIRGIQANKAQIDK